MRSEYDSLAAKVKAIGFQKHRNQRTRAAGFGFRAQCLGRPNCASAGPRLGQSWRWLLWASSKTAVPGYQL